MKNKLQGEFTKKQKIGHQSPYFTFVKDQFEIVIQGKGRDQFQCTCRGGNEGGGQVGSRDDGYFKVPLFGRGGRQREKKQQGNRKEQGMNRVSARNATGLGGSSWLQQRHKVGTWPQLTHRKDPLLALLWKIFSEGRDKFF